MRTCPNESDREDISDTSEKDRKDKKETPDRKDMSQAIEKDCDDILTQARPWENVRRNKKKQGHVKTSDRGDMSDATDEQVREKISGRARP